MNKDTRIAALWYCALYVLSVLLPFAITYAPQNAFASKAPLCTAYGVVWVELEGGDAPQKTPEPRAAAVCGLCVLSHTHMDGVQAVSAPLMPRDLSVWARVVRPHREVALRYHIAHDRLSRAPPVFLIS